MSTHVEETKTTLSKPVNCSYWLFFKMGSPSLCIKMTLVLIGVGDCATSYHNGWSTMISLIGHENFDWVLHLFYCHCRIWDGITTRFFSFWYHFHNVNVTGHLPGLYLVDNPNPRAASPRRHMGHLSRAGFLQGIDHYSGTFLFCTSSFYGYVHT
jgi:hypothetical protein